MNWTTILPKELNINDLSFDECRNFKQFHELIIQNIAGPPGFKLFYKFLNHLLFYTVCCLEEKRFPALNACWDKLYPIFGTAEFDNEWMFYCWLCCDFPLNQDSNKVLLDDFTEFTLTHGNLPQEYQKHLTQFTEIMKASRLGLHQEILSTSKITKFKELFTNRSISTVRSVPYYEPGEIFVTRIVSYLGDSFQVHNAKCYPAEIKQQVINMVDLKLFMISNTGDTAQDYERFMK